MIRIGRRYFLAAGGATLVALPFLDSLRAKGAKADDNSKRFAIFVQQTYGVQQAARFGGPHGNEADGFWPDLGVGQGQKKALSANMLPEIGASDRALHELRGLEQHLSIMRGIRYNELDQGHHETRRTQMYTGSAFTMDDPNNDRQDHGKAWGRHESIDNLMCRKLDGGRPVLVAKSPDWKAVSFDTSRTANRWIENPMAVYEQFFRAADGNAEQEAERRLATDLVASELSSLKSDPRLSNEDRSRIERHFDLLRGVERNLTCAPPGLESDKFRHLRGSQLPDGDGFFWNRREYAEDTTLAFMEVLALGASCGSFRTAIAEAQGFMYQGTDIFPEGEARRNGFPSWYHQISHRTLSQTDGDAQFQGTGVAVPEHHKIDRWHVRKYRFLLDRLKELQVLDNGLTVFTNEISTGAHEATDIPYVIAGNCGGKLKNGFYADYMPAGSPNRDGLMPNNRLLNTIGAAMGLTSEDGAPLHDFGGYREDGSRDEGGFVNDLVNW